MAIIDSVVDSKTKQKKPHRRTQEERRASTRAALLNATVECLVEYGYSNTTTTRVVERAGVSRGAQVHHFPTKLELVTEAVSHLAGLRRSEIEARLAGMPKGRNRLQAALDVLWEIHTGPLFQASLELWVAARTDAELRAALVPVEREVIAGVAELAPELFGDYAKQASFGANLVVVISAIQGLAMRGSLIASSKRDLGDSWTTLRGRLELLFAAD